MKWSKWLENWDMTSLKINLSFLELEWLPSDPDRDAAWEMYVELLTRVTTQPLPSYHGSEKAALESAYQLFPITRDILRRAGRDCGEFAKIAVIVLNQTIRPFTTKWHLRQTEGVLDEPEQRAAFRLELDCLRSTLIKYAGMLAEMAGVEDISALERPCDSARPLNSDESS